MALDYLETLGDATDVTGIAVTANASANTIGSWTNIGGTSSGAAKAIEIQVTQGAQGVHYLVDIGVDEAGGSSFTEIIGEIPLFIANSGTSDDQYTTVIGPLNMDFASGSQFAARVQASTGSSVVDVAIVLYDGTTDYTVAYVETLGANTADSGGVQVDPGATSTTKGSYAQLEASTSSDIDLMIPVIQSPSAATVHNGTRVRVDIASGAASSEVVRVGDIIIAETFAEQRYCPGGPYEVEITSGSRVAARAISGSTTSGRRELEAAVLGFKRTSSGGGGGSGIAQIVGEGGIVG